MTDNRFAEPVPASLISVRGSDRARRRYEQALWYAWGRQDAGDQALARHRSPHHIGDDFLFAEYAAMEAEQYENQRRTMLDNIGAQYRRFVAELDSATGA